MITFVFRGMNGYTIRHHLYMTEHTEKLIGLALDVYKGKIKDSDYMERNVFIDSTIPEGTTKQLLDEHRQMLEAMAMVAGMKGLALADIEFDEDELYERLYPKGRKSNDRVRAQAQ